MLYHQVISLNKLKIKNSQTFASEKIKTLQLYSISFSILNQKYLFDKFNFEINENQIVGVLVSLVVGNQHL